MRGDMHDDVQNRPLHPAHYHLIGVLSSGFNLWNACRQRVLLIPPPLNRYPGRS